MELLPADKSWRATILIALVLFLITRTATLTAFPIFNDESIYLQYSQAIHDDWAKNKFISMHGDFHDWKPPLQYWLAAPVIRLGGDPLVAGRAVAMLFSVLGFFGFYAFTRELFGEAEGVIAGICFLLCPPVLLHNNQFTAETFLFSIAPILYWAILRAMRPGVPRWGWAFFGIALGAALLLFKQSGFLLLAVALVLPWVRSRGDERTWKMFAKNFGVVVAIVLLASLTAKISTPSQFNATRQQFDSKWVMSVSELLRLPSDVWRANFQVVGDYIGAYYTWMVPVFLSPLLLLANWRRHRTELALLTMGVIGAGAVTFLLRGFNEYMFNTAIIPVLLPLLARAATETWNLRRIGWTGLLRASLCGIAAFILGQWTYQLALMSISPGRYIERSTPWAVHNYLKNWSTGFGVNEIVALLDRIEEPGVVFADTQWGNPRTAIELYQDRFPNLKVIPITKEFLDAEETRTLRDFARKFGTVHLVIFSAADPDGRTVWQEIVGREMCEERTEVKEYPGQTPIVVCRF